MSNEQKLREALHYVRQVLTRPIRIDSHAISCVVAKCDEALALPTTEPAEGGTDWERIARVQDAKLRAMCNEPGGFEKLREVMARYEATKPAEGGEVVAQVSDLFPSLRNKLHAAGYGPDAPLYTSPPASQEQAQQPTTQAQEPEKRVVGYVDAHELMVMQKGHFEPTISAQPVSEHDVALYTLATLPTTQAQESHTKVETGSEMHFNLLMAPYSLNMVVGQDRKHLLAFARDVWNAALTFQPQAQELPDERAAFEQAFELIFEAYATPADKFNGYEPWALWQHGKVIKAFSLMQKHRAALAAKTVPDDVRKDAERYRWLRDVAWNDGSLVYFDRRYGNEEWDERIDSAIAAQGEKHES